MNEVAGCIEESTVAIGQIPRDLAHPLTIGLLKDPGDIDSTSLEIDDEENEISNQSRSRKHFDAEEIRRNDGSPIFLQERLPRHSAFSGWGDSILEKNPLDGIATDLMPEVVERSSDSRVAPARIIAGHSKDQCADFS